MYIYVFFLSFRPKKFFQNCFRIVTCFVHFPATSFCIYLYEEKMVEQISTSFDTDRKVCLDFLVSFETFKEPFYYTTRWNTLLQYLSLCLLSLHINSRALSSKPTEIPAIIKSELVWSCYLVSLPLCNWDYFIASSCVLEYHVYCPLLPFTSSEQGTVHFTYIGKVGTSSSLYGKWNSGPSDLYSSRVQICLAMH